MVTAVDTNVLSALLSGGEAESERAGEALSAAADAGTLIACPIVYAELRAAPQGTEQEVAAVLAALRIELDRQLSERVWREAAAAFRAYAERRRTQRGAGRAKRLLADFVVGAHALSAGGRLLTFDQGKYRAAFAELEVLP